jgi:prepilin-type N-terminal cleavage/methylation domain-containing protein
MEKMVIETYRGFKQRRSANEADAGFTLIEILIVIVVLGILAAVVIEALGGITGKSAISACSADGATVNTAVAVLEHQNTGVGSAGGAGITTTLTSSMLLAGGGVTGDPYLASWPSNSPHYAYAIATAAGGSGAGAYVAGDLTIQVPASTGTATLYLGPASCANVT